MAEYPPPHPVLTLHETMLWLMRERSLKFRSLISMPLISPSTGQIQAPGWHYRRLTSSLLNVRTLALTASYEVDYLLIARLIAACGPHLKYLTLTFSRPRLAHLRFSYFMNTVSWWDFHWVTEVIKAVPLAMPGVAIDFQIDPHNLDR
ncbi:hypothetical protein DXG01_016930 [Tephrocybe rancida]|nr:hypothetical protein DXG01_016930 [Tephrocybe rancida]